LLAAGWSYNLKLGITLKWNSAPYWC